MMQNDFTVNVFNANPERLKPDNTTLYCDKEQNDSSNSTASATSYSALRGIRFTLPLTNLPLHLQPLLATVSLLAMQALPSITTIIIIASTVTVQNINS